MQGLLEHREPHLLKRCGLPHCALNTSSNCMGSQSGRSLIITRTRWMA